MKKIIEKIINNREYEFKIGDMCIEISYSKEGKSFNECMLNILKQKGEKDAW